MIFSGGQWRSTALEREPFRQRVMEAPCPLCGAQAGLRCVGKRGQVRKSVHRSRIVERNQMERRPMFPEPIRINSVDDLPDGFDVGDDLDALLMLHSLEPEEWRSYLREGQVDRLLAAALERLEGVENAIPHGTLWLWE